MSVKQNWFNSIETPVERPKILSELIRQWVKAKIPSESIPANTKTLTSDSCSAAKISFSKTSNRRWLGATEKFADSNRRRKMLHVKLLKVLHYTSPISAKAQMYLTCPLQNTLPQSTRKISKFSLFVRSNWHFRADQSARLSQRTFERHFWREFVAGAWKFQKVWAKVGLHPTNLSEFPFPSFVMRWRIAKRCKRTKAERWEIFPSFWFWMDLLWNKSTKWKFYRASESVLLLRRGFLGFCWTLL